MAGLVEGADELCGLADRDGEARAIARIDPEIAVAQVVGRKQRRSAGAVEHDVAMRYRAVARRPEPQRIARGRHRHRKRVDRQPEGAEMPGRLADRALRDRKRHCPWRDDSAPPGKPHSYVEPTGALPPGHAPRP